MVVSECCRGYGYLNLRTFIASADGQLTNAFADFRAQGVTDIIIDFRYNGGGLVSTANLMGDLLGAGRAGQIFSQTRRSEERRVGKAVVSPCRFRWSAYT